MTYKKDYSFLENAEVTSEKNGIAQNYDGKFTAIYGLMFIFSLRRRYWKRHLFSNRYWHDRNYNSVIGMKKKVPSKEWERVKLYRLEPRGSATISGAIIATNRGG